MIIILSRYRYQEALMKRAGKISGNSIPAGRWQSNKSLRAAVLLVLSPNVVADVALPDDSLLQPMTVTARRTEELARDIPFSVSSISGDEGEIRRLHSLEDVLRQIPSLDFVVSMGSANTTLRIRGVGALQKVSGDDTSVVINVDGIPMSATNATLNVLDAERVEVLKGPQGTLFGRNSEAGAVNIVTRKPTQWLEGQFRAEIGSDNQRLLEGIVSGPLGESVSGRLAVRGSGMDSYITNNRDGNPISKPRELSGRASLQWNIAPGSRLNASAAHEDQEDRDWIYQLHPYGDKPRSSIPPGSEANRRVVNRYNVELNHQFTDTVLTALTGFARTRHRSTTPIYEGRTYKQLLGFEPDAIWNSRASEAMHNHEVRLASTSGSRIFWVAGGNLFGSDRTLERFDSYDNFYTDNPTTSDTQRNFSTRARALFGEVTLPVSEATKLTLGGRYTWERKTYRAQWFAAPSNSSPIRTARDAQKLSDSYATGRLAVNHKINQQTNLYAIYSRGYKSSGFDDEGINFVTGAADSPYKAATVDSYETGFKFENHDRRIGLNVAVFLNRVKNDHMLAFNPVTMSTNKENHDTQSHGLELDGQWQIGGGWALSGGLAYTRARISSSTPGSAVGKGNGVPEVPRWGASMTVSHRQAIMPLLGLSAPVIETRLTNRYVGKRPADPQNTFNLGAYNKVDLRTGIRQGGTELYLWADNLLDKQYDLYGYHIDAYSPGGSDARIGMPGRGRSFGLGLSHAF